MPPLMCDFDYFTFNQCMDSLYEQATLLFAVTATIIVAIIQLEKWLRRRKHGHQADPAP